MGIAQIISLLLDKDIRAFILRVLQLIGVADDPKGYVSKLHDAIDAVEKAGSAAEKQDAAKGVQDAISHL